MSFELDRWMSNKKTGDVLLEHVGNFTSAYIDSILPSVEESIESHIEFDGIRKKAFHIFVECIQNLFHHVDPLEFVGAQYGYDRLGALVLSKEGSFCHITTGNFVNREKQLRIVEMIDHLNSLTDVEIKKLYRDTINNREFSAKGGAGIGMIDIARKTGNKLIYQFYKVDGHPETMIFSFDVYIS